MMVVFFFFLILTTSLMLSFLKIAGDLLDLVGDDAFEAVQNLLSVRDNLISSFLYL